MVEVIKLLPATVHRSRMSLQMSAITPEEIAYQQAHIGDNRGPTIVGLAVFFIVFPTIVVALRFVARSVRKLPLGLDDYFTLPALVSVLNASDCPSC
jgi:hypothetical protein